MEKYDKAFVQLISVLKNQIEAREYLHSKNENRLIRMFDNSNARRDMRLLHNSIEKLLD